jgi:pantetheine-phosphate adenylyltransferase
MTTIIFLFAVIQKADWYTTKVVSILHIKRESNMNVIAFAGSFDPPTLGHFDVLARLATCFDKVIVVVAKNEKKKNMFTVEERIDLIKNNRPYNNIEVTSCPDDVLLVDWLRKHDVHLMARGIREINDLVAEMNLFNVNYEQVQGDVETIFFPTRQKFSHISSSAVKTLAMLDGGSISDMVTEDVEKAVRIRLGQGDK